MGKYSESYQSYLYGLLRIASDSGFRTFVKDEAYAYADKPEKECTEEGLEMIERAISFASVAHDNQKRKGAGIPYIIHCIETAAVVAGLTNDPEVISAGILHDIIEDTKYTYEDIKKDFGERVADLVGSETEEKMRDKSPESTWKIRKQKALEHFKEASSEARMIALGDKLSNIRMSVKTYDEKGDDMWLVFNQKDKSEQEWYYRSIGELLSEFSDTVYWKRYMECVDYVFGKKI